MVRNATMPLLFAVGLSTSGCSQTYDGTVVPTYQMGVGRYAGIPYLKIERTPLEEPRVAMEAEAARTTFPPPPPAAAIGAAVTGAALPAEPRLRRAAPRRTVPAVVTAAEKTLVCQNRESEDRAVSMVCE